MMTNPVSKNGTFGIPNASGPVTRHSRAHSGDNRFRLCLETMATFLRTIRAWSDVCWTRQYRLACPLGGLSSVGIRLGLFFAALLVCSSVGYAQATWLFSPYRVQVFVDLEPGPPMTEDGLAQFHAQLATRLRGMVGHRWNLSVDHFPTEIPPLSLDLGNPPSRERLPSEWKNVAKYDKVMLVRATNCGVGWSVRVREWDVRLEQWGQLVILATPGMAGLSDAMAQAILSAHVPVGEIQITEEQIVRVALRGSLLGEPGENLATRTMPQLFLAAARYEDREGNARAIIPIPWTVLKPLSPDKSQPFLGIECQVISGLRNPLSARRRGRVRIYAYAAQPTPETPTRLRLRSRQEGQKPLVGYEVYLQAAGDGPTVFLGRTDVAGEITVPGTDPWYLISIKHGQRLLARVPLVPGQDSPAEVALPDDEARLTAETYLSGIQDELVDLVTARTIMVARMRARMIAQDWQAAQRIRDQLLRLKPREIFSSELTRQQQRIFCPDPVGQKQIDLMFSEMQRLIQVYLNPAEVEQLVKLLASRQKPAT